jgi:hypothetical protein
VQYLTYKESATLCIPPILAKPIPLWSRFLQMVSIGSTTSFCERTTIDIYETGMQFMVRVPPVTGRKLLPSGVDE